MVCYWLSRKWKQVDLVLVIYEKQIKVKVVTNRMSFLS